MNSYNLILDASFSFPLNENRAYLPRFSSAESAKNKYLYAIDFDYCLTHFVLPGNIVEVEKTLDKMIEEHAWLLKVNY